MERTVNKDAGSGCTGGNCLNKVWTDCLRISKASEACRLSYLGDALWSLWERKMLQLRLVDNFYWFGILSLFHRKCFTGDIFIYWTEKKYYIERIVDSVMSSKWILFSLKLQKKVSFRVGEICGVHVSIDQPKRAPSKLVRLSFFSPR
jgi:hypothetical protein